MLEPAEHDEASHWRPKKTFGHVMPQEPNVTCFHVRYTDCTCYQDELAVVINEIKKGNWKFSTIFSSQERRFLPLERRDLCNCNQSENQVTYSRKGSLRQWIHDETFYRCTKSKMQIYSKSFNPRISPCMVNLK